MTRKVIQHILTICLLFSSVILLPHAEAAGNTATRAGKPQIKKTPEANFEHGIACLHQKNTACAQVYLAAIPSVSSYSKLLQGLIAASENNDDQALLLLLPLQTEPQLSGSARITLHENLAEIFKHLSDTLQAAQHLLLADQLLQLNQSAENSGKIELIHENLWKLLENQSQDELITLRGNNTDPIFQGWIDLSLSTRNPNPQAAITSWNSLYTDHPASILSKKLSEQLTTPSSAANTLPADIRIALILPDTDTLHTEKLSAFKNGLETAIRLNKLAHPLKIYESGELTPDLDSRITAAKNDGFQYLIIPHLEHDANRRLDTSENLRQLHIGLNLNDEASTIAAFASGHAMQKALIVTSLLPQSQAMLLSMKRAWEEQTGFQDHINIIQLPQDITANSSTILELKSQLSAQPHDVVFLALSHTEVLTIRPYLDASMPTITFSDIHETNPDQSKFSSLNAIRFADIPWLLQADASWQHFDMAAAALNNILKRWFALGADSLQLVMSSGQSRQAGFNGLSGAFSITETGEIKRSLFLGRFTHQSVTTDE